MFFHSVVHVCFVSLRVGEAPEGKCQLTPKLYQKEQGKQISGSDVFSSFTSLDSKWGSRYCLFCILQKQNTQRTWSTVDFTGFLPELGLWTKTNKLCTPRRFNIHHTWTCWCSMWPPTSDISSRFSDDKHSLFSLLDTPVKLLVNTNIKRANQMTETWYI